MVRLSSIMFTTGLLMSVATASAQTKYFVIGSGTESCGQRLQPSNPYVYHYQDMWIQGYLSAYNYYGPGDGHIQAGTKPSGYFAWIDNYCRTNSLDDIETATRELIKEFEKRKKQ